ncbi:hypothetical protein GCM10008967_12270 [Bacillus carboniphilus]|uniref:DUF4129 domain-containing protein n=1 Tax=Bacillus carboniphilus TaxID=86663 RepID=A0ABP3FQF0_9BACI
MGKATPYIVKLVSDGIGAMLILFPFYFASDQLPPIGSLFTTLLVCGLIFGYFLANDQKLNKKLLVVLVIAVTVIFGMLFKHSTFLILATMIFITMRGFTYSDNGLESVNGKKLMYATLLTFALYTHAASFGYEYYYWVPIVFVVYIWIVSFERFTFTWVESKLDHSQKFPVLGMVVAAVVLPFVVAFTGPIVFPFIREGAMLLVIGTAYLFSWVVEPLYNFAMSLQGAKPETEEVQMGISELLRDIHNQADMVEHISLPTTLIFIAIVFILVAILAFIIYRGKLIPSIASGLDIDYIYDKVNSPFSKMKWKFNSEPSIVVRKQVWNLEKYAVKKKMDRNWNETLSEWFHRLGISKQDSSKYIEIYNACRYGEKQVAEDEINWFTLHTKQIREQIKHASNSKKREKD